jgi:hypothetical protein
MLIDPKGGSCRDDRSDWGEDDQAYLGARATSGPGDKMMDWVPPARGGCGRSFFGGRPQGPARQSQYCELTAAWREPAALIPIG